jgi:hypothetical protein
MKLHPKNAYLRSKVAGPLSGLLALTLLSSISACNLPSRVGEEPALSTASNGDITTPSRTRGSHANGAEETEAGGPAFTPAPTETVVHQRAPGEPGSVLYFAADYSSKAASAYHAASGGDYYLTNLFERPFTAEAMDYLPEIDILRADIAKDGTWLYATIRLEEAPAAGAEAWYGVEVDADLDGQGDYLIRTYAPAGTEWTTDGVQIWEDGNGDVGGTKPLRTETDWTGDGYEHLAFDRGRGEDPDSAWARSAPGNPKYVQLAFLQSAVENDMKFLWSAWAEKGEGDPGGFDYNDLYTPAEAGSAMKGQAEYPLKALAAVDNTCRMSMGFELTGSEPGACPVAQPTPTPTLTLTPTQTPTQTNEPLLISGIEVHFSQLHYSDFCPFFAHVTIRITATGTGTVYYDVFRARSPESPAFWTDGAEYFVNGGTHSIALDWKIENQGIYRVLAHITSPVSLWSTEKSMGADCGTM